MDILKLLLVGIGLYATLAWSEIGPSSLELALLTGLWAGAIALVFLRIRKRRK